MSSPSVFGKTSRIRSLQPELVAFMQTTLRIPSVIGSEGELARFLLASLEDLGVDEAWIDEIGNVVAVLRGQGRGPRILLNSHLDTVPPGRRETWSHDPFGGELADDGNLYGLGAVDIKGGLAGQFFAFKLLAGLRREGQIALPGDLIFSCVSHEEAAECFGMQYLCEHSLPAHGLAFDLCLLGEPSHGVLVLGHRGKVEIVVTVRGKTAHSSTPWLGINALEQAIPILDYVFHTMPGQVETHPQLGQTSATITNLVCRPGGLSIVPDEVEISIDRRYLPGRKLEEIVAEFEALFARLRLQDPRFEASVGVRTFHEKSYTGYEDEAQKHHAAWITPEDHPFVQAAQRGLRAAGQPAETGYWKFGTDGSWTAGVLGIPTLGFQWGHERLAHTPDEHISVEELVLTAEGYAAMLGELYGLGAGVLDLAPTS